MTLPDSQLGDHPDVTRAEPDVLTFNETEHTYHLGQRQLPGVTDILKVAGVIDTEWFTEEHTRRGKRVHIATAMHDEGRPVPGLEPELQGYLAAWCKFLDQTKAEIISIEDRVWSAAWGVAGTLDRRLGINGWTTTGDIKTGGPAPWHKLQTAGYGVCQGTRRPRMCIYLKPDGTYKIETHHGASDYDAFHCALGMYNWKLGNGVIK